MTNRMSVACFTPDERMREALAGFMDNRCVDVLSAGRRHLELALELLMGDQPVTHYLQEESALVLLTAAENGASGLVAPLKTAQQLTSFVETWLINLAEPQGELADPDVTNEPIAFRVWSGAWGQDVKYSSGIGRVQARYAWVGK